MSAAALFTPGAGSFHTPHSQRLNALPPRLRVAASEAWHAILDLLRRGQTATDERITDRVLSQHMGRSRRFVQKGLKALQDLGMIRRRRQFGRRVIIVLERLRGRPKPQPKPKAADAKPAPAKLPSVPNVGVILPATPEQLAAAKATIAANMARDHREPTAEEKAEVDRFLEESRRRRQAAERARERPKVVIVPTPAGPAAPGLTAQAALEARRQAMGIRVAPEPARLADDPRAPAGREAMGIRVAPDPDQGPGSPALPAGP